MIVAYYLHTDAYDMDSLRCDACGVDLVSSLSAMRSPGTVVLDTVLDHHYGRHADASAWLLVTPPAGKLDAVAAAVAEVKGQ